MKRSKGTGTVTTIASALAAAFGVQSNANRKRDFEDGKPIHFIIAGFAVTITFIVIVLLMVHWMIASNN